MKIISHLQQIAQNLIQLINCRILRNHSIIQDDLWIRNGKIVNPEKVFFDEQTSAKIQIDCKNAIISPGFIELQINGGFGVDFSYDTGSVEQGVNAVAKGLLAYGVTSFCPTLVTSPAATYHTVLPKICKRQGNQDGATILGVHLEGPFINKTKKGAHSENAIQDLENGMQTLLETYGDLKDVSIITLAPEKINALEVIKKLTEQGIIVSVGHSMANLKDGEQAVTCGAVLITHLFNAMLPFHHRDPGLVGLLASQKIPQDRIMYFGIISDGVHTHPAALRIAHRTHPNGLIVVSDAISALGLEDGLHHIGELDVEIRSGRAYIAGTDTLCGSIAPMDECVRNFKKSTDCTLVYALETATLHPAKCLKIDKTKGTLNYDADADFIFLNDDLKVRSTWIAGKCVYLAEDKTDPLIKEFSLLEFR